MIYFIHSVGAGELFDTVMVTEGYMRMGGGVGGVLRLQREGEKRCIKIFSVVKVKIIVHRKKTHAP